MTEAELQQYKEKVKKLMVEHLTTTIKYPDCTDEQIIQELKPMYLKLEEAGLILPGFNFQLFATIAQDQYTFTKLKQMAGF